MELPVLWHSLGYTSLNDVVCRVGRDRLDNCARSFDGHVAYDHVTSGPNNSEFENHTWGNYVLTCIAGGYRFEDPRSQALSNSDLLNASSH